MKKYSLVNAICYEICRLIVEQSPTVKNNWIVSRIMEYCFQDWVEWKAKTTMASVDQQADKLKQDWKAQENQAFLQKIQKENPGAKVTIHNPETGAVLIQYPPDGSIAQTLLGGDIEIRSPGTYGN